MKGKERERGGKGIRFKWIIKLRRDFNFVDSHNFFNDALDMSCFLHNIKEVMISCKIFCKSTKFDSPLKNYCWFPNSMQHVQLFSNIFEWQMSSQLFPMFIRSEFGFLSSKGNMIYWFSFFKDYFDTLFWKMSWDITFQSQTFKIYIQ